MNGQVGASLEQVRFTAEDLAYLSSLFHEEPTSEWGEIHRAIWNIASGESLSNPTSRSLATSPE